MKSQINFDNRGYLKPYTIIDLSIVEFEEIFVNSFKDSQTRKKIFQEYQRYTADLQQLIQRPFTQWIDGSFVSNCLNPRDIDLVTFIDYRIYEQKESLIEKRFGKWKVANFYGYLDAYTVCAYPQNHTNHLIFQSDKLYWKDWFGTSRFNRVKKRYPKGFIQLKID